ncbi:MAG: hypothetical protein RMJ16_01635 [Thermoguttaceae bacterium]|nr:hypothetical protein [Thermoguttaceae bacterium]
MTALLIWLSLCYIFVPFIIFFFGWLKPVWAFICTGSLLLATGLAGRWILPVFEGTKKAPLGRVEETTGQTGGSFGGRVAAGATALCLVAAIVSLWGAGGYGPQDSDHPKHNAVLKALIEHPWPTYLESDRGQFPLVFYIAYYLPSALIGKLWGWEAASHALQLWSVTGLVLCLAWFWILVGRISWVVPVVFFFFSGWDVIGAAVIRFWHWWEASGASLTDLLSSVDWFALRWWNWQMRWFDPELARNYPSPIEHLFFVPHQVLAGWIVVGMITASGLRAPGAALAIMGVLCTLLVLWAPLILLGLLPLVLWLLWEAERATGSWKKVGKLLLSTCNLLAIPAFLAIALYYAARWAPLPFSGVAEAGFGIGHASFTWFMFLIRITLFLLVEVAIFALLLLWLRPFENESEYRLFGLSLAWVLVLPFFRYGACNDLVMRASVPALFLFAVWIARSLTISSTPVMRRLIVAGCLLIGSTAPFSDLYAHFREAIRRGQIVQIPAKEKVRSLWELNQWSARQAETSTHPLVRLFREQTFFLQYVGSEDTVFFRYLARKGPEEVAPDGAAASNRRGNPD